MSKSRLLLETDGKPWVMFIVGPLHTRDHDPGCSIANTKPTMMQGKGSYLYTLQEVSNRGDIIPHGTHGGPQVESKF